MRGARSGLTVLELLIAMAILMLLTIALSQAFTSGIRFTSTLDRSQEIELRRLQFEDEIRSLFEEAYLTANPEDFSTFFVGGIALGAVGGQGGEVAFTTVGARMPRNYLDADLDFEGLNEAFGPQGGVREVGLSMFPVGPAQQMSGLFLREQVPADGDPTQGGIERVFHPDVESIEFEFFDGSNWTTEWDTRDPTLRFLPFLVRISYRFSDENERRTLVVRLPMAEYSYVEYQNLLGGAGQ